MFELIRASSMQALRSLRWQRNLRVELRLAWSQKPIRSSAAPYEVCRILVLNRNSNNDNGNSINDNNNNNIGFKIHFAFARLRVQVAGSRVCLRIALPLGPMPAADAEVQNFPCRGV